MKFSVKLTVFFSAIMLIIGAITSYVKTADKRDRQGDRQAGSGLAISLSAVRSYSFYFSEMLYCKT